MGRWIQATVGHQVEQCGDVVRAAEGHSLTSEHSLERLLDALLTVKADHSVTDCGRLESRSAARWSCSAASISSCATLGSAINDLAFPQRPVEGTARLITPTCNGRRREDEHIYWNPQRPKQASKPHHFPCTVLYFRSMTIRSRPESSRASFRA